MEKPSAHDLAIASDLAYAVLPTDSASERLNPVARVKGVMKRNSRCKGWKVIDANHNTVAFETPTGVIIAHRGTNPRMLQRNRAKYTAQDLIADGAIAVGMRPRLRIAQARQFSDRVKRMYRGTKPIVHTGHSLGGCVAVCLSRLLGEPATVFNSGKPVRVPLLYRKNDPNIKYYHVIGDVISAGTYSHSTKISPQNDSWEHGLDHFMNEDQWTIAAETLRQEEAEKRQKHRDTMDLASNLIELLVDDSRTQELLSAGLKAVDIMLADQLCTIDGFFEILSTIPGLPTELREAVKVYQTVSKLTALNDAYERLVGPDASFEDLGQALYLAMQLIPGMPKELVEVTAGVYGLSKIASILQNPNASFLDVASVLSIAVDLIPGVPSEIKAVVKLALALAKLQTALSAATVSALSVAAAVTGVLVALAVCAASFGSMGGGGSSSGDGDTSAEGTPEGDDGNPASGGDDGNPASGGDDENDAPGDGRPGQRHDNAAGSGHGHARVFDIADAGAGSDDDDEDRPVNYDSHGDQHDGEEKNRNWLQEILSLQDVLRAWLRAAENIPERKEHDDAKRPATNINVHGLLQQTLTSSTVGQLLVRSVASVANAVRQHGNLPNGNVLTSLSEIAHGLSLPLLDIPALSERPQDDGDLESKGEFRKGKEGKGASILLDDQMLEDLMASHFSTTDSKSRHLYAKLFADAEFAMAVNHAGFVLEGEDMKDSKTGTRWALHDVDDLEPTHEPKSRFTIRTDAGCSSFSGVFRGNQVPLLTNSERMYLSEPDFFNLFALRYCQRSLIQHQPFDNTPAEAPRNEPRWVLMTEYVRAQSAYLVDRRSQYQGYIDVNVLTLECKREYVSTQNMANGQPRIYRIYTRNTEQRGSFYFGVCKHNEAAQYNNTVDWGTQSDLRGTCLRINHRDCTGQGSNNWRHSGLTTARATVMSDDGRKFVAQRNSYGGYQGYSGPCYSGGLHDGLTNLCTSGSSPSHSFAAVGPEGHARSRYSSTMQHLARVRIWILYRDD
jgi:hypothetical protein